MCKIIGIDISKQTFDLSFLKKEKWHHEKLTNDTKGFKKLLKETSEDDWIVMEASGPYYLKLATFFHNHGIKVSVVNPLIIKRFSQANLYRAKTDKKDSKTIAEYGSRFDLQEWKPDSETISKIRQLYTRIEMLDKQIHQNNRQKEAFQSSGIADKALMKEIEKNIKQLMKSKEKLDTQIRELVEKEYHESMEFLCSIPGIGPKAAIILIVLTNNFENFENANQLTAYVGFSPRIYQSGTSVHGRGHICKMGSSQVRKILYMCSWAAKKYNPSCAAMYQRLKEKGKPERVIKIAIANKLLRQAFAVGKNKVYFQENFA